MSFPLRRWLVPVSAMAALLAGAVPAPAAVVDPVPVKPNQAFTPLVNGQSGAARIAVNCDGPAGSTPTGHPVAGQTVAVRLAPSVRRPGDGFTGTTANAITVGLNVFSSADPPVVLRAYGPTTPIPTDILMPCDRASLIRFTPTPANTTAHRGVVDVVFVSQGSSATVTDPTRQDDSIGTRPPGCNTPNTPKCATN